MKKLLTLGLLLLCLSVSAAVVGTNQVVNVRLTWDVSPDLNVTGYKVYWGVSTGNYTNSVNSVGRTNVFSTCSNLVANTTYYFAATAYNVTGLESLFSNEVQYTPFNSPPTNAPTQLRISIQTQASTHPINGFENLAGAVVTITNTYDPLIPGYFYKQLIVATPIVP
jgi:hypothetical protein